MKGDLASAIAKPPSSGGGSRIRAIDWLRGLAVFDMILWHSAGLLSPGHSRETLGLLGGLVAPAFLFAAGYAIALVVVRASASPDPAARRRRAVKSLQRIGEVLLVAFILRYLTRSSFDPTWPYAIDILNCIALTLLAVFPIMYAGGKRPGLTGAFCALLGLACFFVAPHVPADFWGDFIKQGSSDFAPIPWSGYVLLGASAGVLASMGLTGVALTALFFLGAAFKFLPWAAIVGGEAWILTNHGERFLMVFGTALALYSLEKEANERGWKLSFPPFSFLELVGTSALTAYTAHIILLYYPIPNPIYHFSYWRVWGQKLDWSQYALALLSLWAVTMLVCKLWPYVDDAVRSRLPWNRGKKEKGA